MTSEYVRLGGQFPEEIEWQIRQFSWPKYRKPLNKETLIRLNNGIRQDLDLRQDPPRGQPDLLALDAAGDVRHQV